MPKQVRQDMVDKLIFMTEMSYFAIERDGLHLATALPILYEDEPFVYSSDTCLYCCALESVM